MNGNAGKQSKVPEKRLRNEIQKHFYDRQHEENNKRVHLVTHKLKHKYKYES